MPISLADFNPDYLLYGGAAGLFVGLLAIIYFAYRRIRWIIRIFSREKRTSPKLLSSLIKLLTVLVWTSCFGMLIFIGAFLRAYHAFTSENPVAVIRTENLNWKKANPVGLVHLTLAQSQNTRHFIINGDQWMIEGDILKWQNWLNFLGLSTRYRLTRLRGRYFNVEAELNEPRSVHSLVEQENNPLWRHLYQFGQRLPFVSTVYGNASFQNLNANKTYTVYVGTSGFIVREKTSSR